MLGVGLGARRGLPVEVAQAGAAGGAAVEHQEHVARRRQDRVADRRPGDRGDRTEALAGFGYVSTFVIFHLKKGSE